MLEACDLPLHGVRVLDFSQFLAGPVAALRLADLGADVTKVERPGVGEIGRTLAFAGRWADGDTLSFHAMNRNKRSVVADLKDPADLELVKELVSRADVLLQNFRPGVMARLGLDYETLRAINPGLVYVSATGYGDDGPWVGRPGQDLLAQSVSALPWVMGTGERPMPVGLAVADHLMSCHIAQGVTALLVRKVRTGVGGLVQTSLLEAMLDLQFERLTTRLSELGELGEFGELTECGENTAEGDAATRPAHGRLTAPSGVFATRDGHIALAHVPVDVLSRVLGDPELVRYDGPGRGRDGWADLEAALRTAFASRPTQHWVDLLSGEDGWCTPVLSLEELLRHEAFDAVRMTQEVLRPSRAGGTAPVRVVTTRSPIRIDGHRLVSAKAAPRVGEDGHVRDEVVSDRARHASAVTGERNAALVGQGADDK
ncbi:CoA transferase [Streptomyces sp. NPDC020996]|uniref:CaiB/BaiF CoA transferase family protein n=1 Tax=Streptomyces sp. NPDC020996 TaxID=3154791 RepID=UPI0033E82683